MLPSHTLILRPNPVETEPSKETQLKWLNPTLGLINWPWNFFVLKQKVFRVPQRSCSIEFQKLWFLTVLVFYPEAAFFFIYCSDGTFVRTPNIFSHTVSLILHSLSCCEVRAKIHNGTRAILKTYWIWAEKNKAAVCQIQINPLRSRGGEWAREKESGWKLMTHLLDPAVLEWKG